MPSKTVEIPPMGELRIATHSTRDAKHPERDCYVIVRSSENRQYEGTADAAETQQPLAEVFGAELPTGVPVHVPYGRSVAVFSHCGCSCTVEGDASMLNHDMVVAALGERQNKYHENVVALHQYLDHKRVEARRHPAHDGIGPRVMVVGSVPSSGKSVLCRTLANYCVRGGYHPLYVDLDVRYPQFGYSECISVLPLQVPIDCEEESALVPALSMIFGDADPSANVPLWRHLLKHTALSLDQRAARSERCRVAGVFVDYPTIDEEALVLYDEGVLKGAKQDDHPLDAVMAAIEVLDIDVLLIVGSEWLRWRLSQHMCDRHRNADISLAGALAAQHAALPEGVVHQPFSASRALQIPIAPTSVQLSHGHTVALIPLVPNTAAALPRTLSTMDVAIKQRWLQYFFGTTTSPLRPSLVDVSVAACKIVKIGGVAANAMQGLLPLDEDPGIMDPAVVSYVQPTDMHLAGRIVGVSSATYLRPAAGSDGTYHPVPTSDFEAKLKELHLIGFALIRQATHASLTLLLPETALPQERGHCFVVTNTLLLTT